MKLSEHVDKIRILIDSSIRNRLGRMGINEKSISVTVANEHKSERERIDVILAT